MSPRASVAIEWLRLFLVAQVMFGHLALIGLPPFAALDLHRPTDWGVAAFRVGTRFGAQAAAAFVFLSGYFLVPQLAALARERAPIRPFIARRLRRVYPTLVAAIALTLACDLLGAGGLRAVAPYRTTLNYDAVAALNPVAAVGNLLSLQPTFVAAFGSNGPLWTLGYLVQFYIVGAAAAALFARSAPLAVLALAALAVAAAIFRPEWLALALAWASAGAVSALPASGPRTGMLAAAAGAALFVAANRLPPLFSIAAVAFATAGLVAAARTLTGPAALPRWAAACSRASLAIYAFHFPLAMLVFAGLTASGLLAQPGARAVFIALAVTLILALAIAWERLTTEWSAR